eukprot:TRINITY_DN21637_c0_g1_i1.p1 TRINITY_DN21637_c0_g1~~TRINITY_DN21637_c0_g1_i1.p1  ORF type:complete len:423 (-),score=60.48 TRINITY_DN21637_c0_g1_i1:127-1395(-)
MWGNMLMGLSGWGTVEPNGLQVGYVTNTDPKEISIEENDLLSKKGIDILLSTEWPAKILNHIPNAAEKLFGSSSPQPGSEIVSKFAKCLSPRYHFAATHNRYYARPPYRNLAGHATRFFGLGSFGNSEKQRSLYACKLVPIEKNANLKTPPNITPSPFTMPVTKKRKREEMDSPRNQELVPRWATNDNKNNNPALQYPKRQRLQKNRECWFCLGGQNVEKHLIVSVHTQVYVALAKGGLVDEHILVLPTAHSPNSAMVEAPVSSVFTQYISALRKYFEAKGQGCILYERYFNGNHHGHIQVVPLPLEKVQNALPVFFSEAQKHNVTFQQINKGEQLLDVVQDSLYFYFELSPLERFVAIVGGKTKLPMEFGRIVIATHFLNDPSRAHWKNCVKDAREETGLCTAFQKRFKPYDTIMYSSQSS